MTVTGETQLSVSTQCPLCGAPLDFPETRNAVRCGHCGSNLLVTGRRQVVSYSVRARIDGRTALATARFTIPATAHVVRVEEPRLLWIPYFRLTAEELCWRAPEAVPGRAARLRELASELRIDAEELIAHAASQPPRGEPRVETRRIEHSIVAGGGSIGAPSLGVRSSVLAVRLFDRAAAEAEGTIVAPALSASAARAQMLHALDGERLLHRELLRVQLSTIYFPVWTVEVEGRTERRLIAIDGVTGSVLSREAAPAQDLGTSMARTRTLGFLPLACPNCGWDLPLRPDDVVFHCGSCRRTWQASAGRLFGIRSSVIGSPPGVVAARHLPVWLLPSRIPEGAPAFAPAFRCRRLRALTDLAKRLVHVNPSLESSEDAAAELVGCALDRHDAVALARFVAFEKDPSQRSLPELRKRDARLLWLPFTHDGYAYREAHTGSPVQLRFDLAA